MKSRITRYAAAAVLAVAATVGLITFAQLSATPVWALEQTVAALQNTKSIYLAGTTLAFVDQPTTFETWALPNQDASRSGSLRMETPEGFVMVAQEANNITYIYIPQDNKVIIDHALTAKIDPWMNGDYFKAIREKIADADADWNETYGNDPQTDRQSVFVYCRSVDTNESWWFQFDVESKLPVRAKQWANGNYEGTPMYDVETIHYNIDLPEGVFDFEIPEDAEIVEGMSQAFMDRINDPQYGMAVDPADTLEAAELCARAFCQAAVNQDCELLHQLCPLKDSAEAWRQELTCHPEKNPVEIVNIGPAYWQQGYKLGPICPIALKSQDGSVKRLHVNVKIRNNDGQRSAVIANIFGSDWEPASHGSL